MDQEASKGRGLYRNIKPLVLASASPRREELLRSVGLELEVFPSGIEETPNPGELPDEMALRWAREKTQAVSRIRPLDWVLGADTIVVMERTVFGKPADSVQAASMLKELSGRVHEVITGMCLAYHAKHFVRTGFVRTRVEFRHLSDAEIQAYVATQEPLDKAGAYGIQGIGAALVRSVTGSYTNVVGLPLCETLEWLVDEGVIVPGWI